MRLHIRLDMEGVQKHRFGDVFKVNKYLCGAFAPQKTHSQFLTNERILHKTQQTQHIMRKQSKQQHRMKWFGMFYRYVLRAKRNK